MSSTTINENVIRWSEIRLPDPSRPGELARWKIDGPFALRQYYRVSGSSETVELKHFEHRRADGTLSGCLYCGATSFERRMEARWAPIVVLALAGLGLAYWTYGLSLLAVAYPIWFLWADVPRVERCTGCGAEFVNFRYGPRP